MPTPSNGPIRVLAVDPGEKVGWATATVQPTVFKTQRNTAVDPRPLWQLVEEDGPLPKAGQSSYVDGHTLEVTGHGISYLKDAALQIHKAVVVEDRIDVVVYEKWILTYKGAKVSVGSDMQSSQFIGMVRGYCWLNPRVQLVPQETGAMSSARKSMRAHPSGADIQERLAKLPKSHDESHDGPALLHLWTYFFERFV